MIQCISLGMAVALAISMPLGALAQTRDPAITSDTTAYCGALMNRINGMARAGGMPREAVILSIEGERMCEHGRVRGGILRLRRAIAIIRQPGE